MNNFVFFFNLFILSFFFTLLATCYCEDVKKEGGPDETLVDPAIFPCTQLKNPLIILFLYTLRLKMAKDIVNLDKCFLMSDN